MALGGGTWETQNKVLPGAYISFTSLKKASKALSSRGIAAAPFELKWGKEGEVFAVTADEFKNNSKTIFGYGVDAAEMLALREMFCHATKVFCWRLGTGTKAECTYATAKYAGTRGNDIKIVIAVNVDDDTKYDVSTYVDNLLFETQTVAAAANLKGNAFVDYKTSATLAATTGTALTGGANAESISAENHQSFLNAIESYTFNTLCCPVSDGTVVAVYENFTKRMRDELGAKFQLVAFESDADYEGCIGVWNTVTHPMIAGVDTHALVYWVAGAQAGVSVDQSLTNAIYDGEMTVCMSYTQAQLEAAITAGKFLLHNVNNTVRVLKDINSLVTTTDAKGEEFSDNQTVRVCDAIANDVAALFATKYAGSVQNDVSGRAALWNDVVLIIRELQRIRVVESFDEDAVTVEAGSGRNAVVLTVSGLQIVGAMNQLYMSVVIQ